MLYTCDEKYLFYVKPLTKNLGNGIEVTTWKYDDNQEYYNFEVKFPLDYVKNNFYYHSGGYFMEDYGDYIDCIDIVKLKDELLIISGWKLKGNE